MCFADAVEPVDQSVAFEMARRVYAMGDVLERDVHIAFEDFLGMAAAFQQPCGVVDQGFFAGLEGAFDRRRRSKAPGRRPEQDDQGRECLDRGDDVGELEKRSPQARVEPETVDGFVHDDDPVPSSKRVDDRNGERGVIADADPMVGDQIRIRQDPNAAEAASELRQQHTLITIDDRAKAARRDQLGRL